LDQEVVEERKTLGQKRSVKLDFAKELRKKQDEIGKNVSPQERLKFLLKQIEIFTQFITRSNILSDQREQLIKQAMETPSKKSGAAKKQRHRGQNLKIQENFDDEQILTKLTQQPSTLVGGTLKEFQVDGLNWLIGLYETGVNGILADEMGLGKTIQTISILTFLKEYKKIEGPHLVIVPKSTIGNWMKEFKKWSPTFRVVNLIARKEEREDIIKNVITPKKFDVCLTTFEGARICMSNLNKFNWEYVIVDEAHKIKNEESQISQKLRQFKSNYRLLITGTPLQNNLHELWSLLNYLLPEVFSSSTDFDEWFNLGGSETMELSEAEQEKKNTDMI
jgi:SWI/SNF-related matrix-associated actin-dependent regulator of chromatin subfamily A member 5